jgi:2-polyprenyl-6-hydroxyphenyl methylase/3-demethylubiquinone-9 3-methyltransferase
MTNSKIDVTTKPHSAETLAGERFEFGKNWTRFLSVLNDDRIAEAERSLTEMLQVQSLAGMSFLDVGCGSGLYSLAARRLGAKVHSFDFDPQSVACTRELKRRYYPKDDHWTISEGSALDSAYVETLGQFDIVYSWGVLHHTGRMWDALRIVDLPVRVGGKLFISIYNDQGLRSSYYKRVKRFYCSGSIQRVMIVSVFVPFYVLRGFCFDVLSGKNPRRRYTEYKKKRGMSFYYDLLDWLGGYPFEVATPEKIFDFYSAKNYRVLLMKTTNSHGTNQFVFQKLK